MKTQQKLILASTSKYRKELLERLRIPFEVVAPDVDETPLPKESPAELVLRLATAKAEIVAKANPDAWVIGSDQVADFLGAAIGKPNTHDRAVAQLQLMRGETIIFRTGLCLMNKQTVHCTSVDTEVSFLKSSDETIENYLLAEQPYDCAGSAKSEGLGITLLSSIRSDDPTALVGLPLIALTKFLRSAGFNIPA
jgi:septum formation protein